MARRAVWVQSCLYASYFGNYSLLALSPVEVEEGEVEVQEEGRRTAVGEGKQGGEKRGKGYYSSPIKSRRTWHSGGERLKGTQNKHL